LNHVQAVHLVNIDSRETFGEQVCLLLVVSLEANSIAWSDDGLQQRDDVARFDYLAFYQAPPRLDACITSITRLVPSSHVAFLSGAAQQFVRPVDAPVASQNRTHKTRKFVEVSSD
jgi:hypothetical protein